VTTPDRRSLLRALPGPVRFAEGRPAPGDAVVEVDDSRPDQAMLGFGAALTDSAAYLISRLPATPQTALLRALFDPARGNGFAVLRVPMGASDFTAPGRGSYTYHDLRPGERDPELTRFSVAPDEAYTLPLLRRIRRINPALTVIASPWTAPAWMKTGRKLHGGWLDWPAYPAYARYFVKFVQAYERAGVPVDYVTLQNEPRNETASYPSMRMEPRDQARFVRDHLGPAFRRAGIRTKILVWDHNWDAPEYPLEVLGDAAARPYISGVAWHAYAGRPEAQGRVRRAFPGQEVHFTESSGGDFAPDFGRNLLWDVQNLVVGATRYGARSVLKWNLALDEAHGPRNGGCADCRGVVTIDSKTGAVTRNEEFYALGHGSRFVRPGARRLASSEGDLPNAAFRNPDSSHVLVLCNPDPARRRSVAVRWRGRTLRTALPGGAALTLRW
jgi:glucosylceramidase